VFAQGERHRLQGIVNRSFAVALLVKEEAVCQRSVRVLEPGIGLFVLIEKVADGQLEALGDDSEGTKRDATSPAFDLTEE